MSKGKDDIKKYSQPNTKKRRKSVPDYGTPDRREVGWNGDRS
ncbi:MAG: hypothetical protein AAF915_25545 [Cyanobacteria bacterium P01_D01_bin.50]